MFNKKKIAPVTQTVKPQLRAAQSFGSICAATPRRRWWRVQAVAGCTPATPSCLITSFDRAPWKVQHAQIIMRTIDNDFCNFLKLNMFACVCFRSEVPVFSLFQTFCNREAAERPHENPRSVLNISVSTCLHHTVSIVLLLGGDC